MQRYLSFLYNLKKKRKAGCALTIRLSLYAYETTSMIVYGR